MEFSSRAEQELAFNFNGKLDRPQAISRTDILNVGFRIKHMNVINNAEGLVLLFKAVTHRSDSIASISILTMAIEKFEVGHSVILLPNVSDTDYFCHAQLGLISNPNDKTTLRSCAHALLILDEELRLLQPSESILDSPRVHQALEYLKRAIDIDPTDPMTLLRFAQIHQKMGLREDAEENFLSALETEPSFVAALRAYGLFLESKGIYDCAEQLFSHAQFAKGL